MHFYKLHAELLKSAKDLTNSQKIILSFIVNNSQIKGYCWASREAIATSCGVADSTAKAGLKRLKLLNYIKIVPQDKKGFSRPNHIYPLDKALEMAKERVGHGLKAALIKERKARQREKDIVNSERRQLAIVKSALSKTGIPYDEYYAIVAHLNAYSSTHLT